MLKKGGVAAINLSALKQILQRLSGGKHFIFHLFVKLWPMVVSRANFFESSRF